MDICPQCEKIISVKSGMCYCPYCHARLGGNNPGERRHMDGPQLYKEVDALRREMLVRSADFRQYQILSEKLAVARYRQKIGRFGWWAYLLVVPMGFLLYALIGWGETGVLDGFATLDCWPSLKIALAAALSVVAVLATVKAVGWLYRKKLLPRRIAGLESKLDARRKDLIKFCSCFDSPLVTCYKRLDEEDGSAHVLPVALSPDALLQQRHMGLDLAGTTYASYVGEMNSVESLCKEYRGRKKQLDEERARKDALLERALSDQVGAGECREVAYWLLALALGAAAAVFLVWATPFSSSIFEAQGFETWEYWMRAVSAASALAGAFGGYYLADRSGSGAFGRVFGMVVGAPMSIITAAVIAGILQMVVAFVRFLSL